MALFSTLAGYEIQFHINPYAIAPQETPSLTTFEFHHQGI